MSVAIVGIGIHPFGRFEGVTGLDLGAYAVRQARRRCGHHVAGRAVRVRREPRRLAAGERRVESGRRPGQPARAHGAPVHERAQRVRDRREHARDGCGTDRVGCVRPGGVRRVRQAPARALQRDARAERAPALVRRARIHGHHPVLRDEDPALHARSRDQSRRAGAGRGEELPQRRAEPQCVASEALQRGGDPRVADAELSAHAVHVLLTR